MVRCVNLDWLEVYCMEESVSCPRDADYFISRGYEVSVRDYGTRVYAQMFTILDSNHVPMIEIRRKPLSDISKDGGLFPSEACHIRMCNPYLYTDTPVGTLRNFLATHGYTLVRIFRLDLCLDFETFDLGDVPAKFMERYLNGRYSKVYQSNINAHGIDTWAGRKWNSVSWGQPKSMISTKFYCKSLELAQVHDKPYIRWCWYRCGLIDDPVTGIKIRPDGSQYKPDIWRVEFSIKSSAKKVFVAQNFDTRSNKRIIMNHTLDFYDDRVKLFTVFASLARHYFHFKVYQDGVRKDRCDDKVLFRFSAHDVFFKYDRGASHRPVDRTLERLTWALQRYRERKLNENVKAALDVVIHELTYDRLQDFVGRTWTGEEVEALQLLLSQRLNGYKRPDIVQQRQEIQVLIEQYLPFHDSMPANRVDVENLS